MSKKRSQVHFYFNLWQEKFQVAEDTSIQSVLRKKFITKYLTWSNLPQDPNIRLHPKCDTQPIFQSYLLKYEDQNWSLINTAS